MTTATAASSRTTPAAVEFALLQSWLASGTALELPLHEIECRQQEKGREVQRLLLQAHLRQRGNGDVGPALHLHQQDGKLLYSHRRLGARSLTTVFGTVELVRMGYSRPGVPGIFPLDRALTLPARNARSSLRTPAVRLVKAGVQNPFLDSVQTIADLTGVSVSKRSLEQIVPDAAQDFDAFYRQRSPERATGSILVAAVDCKGIPMVKPLLALAIQHLAAVERAEGQQEAHGHGRRGLHPCALDTHPTTGRGKLVPPLPPDAGCAGAAAPGEQAGLGQSAQGKDRCHSGSSRRDATS